MKNQTLHVHYVFASIDAKGEMGDLYYHDNQGRVDLVHADLHVDLTMKRAKRHFLTLLTWDNPEKAVFHFVNGLEIVDVVAA